jgi:hypothetical protein
MQPWGAGNAGDIENEHQAVNPAPLRNEGLGMDRMTLRESQEPLQPVSDRLPLGGAGGEGLRAANVRPDALNVGATTREGRIVDEPPTMFAPQGPVVVHAPATGWTWAAYRQAIQTFTRERGQAPRTVTLHPDTLEAVMRTTVLQTEQAIIERAVGALQQEDVRLARRLQDEQPLQVITAPEHDRQTIVLE